VNSETVPSITTPRSTTTPTTTTPTTRNTTPSLNRQTPSSASFQIQTPQTNYWKTIDGSNK
jgi:hypothetical protein